MRLVFLFIFSFFFLFSAKKSFAQIIITEINYNSDSTTNSGNWVEIYNKSTSMVNISGWKIKNALNVTYNIPSGTQLNALSYVVVVQDLVKFNSIHSISNKVGPSNVDFGNSGDNVQLLNATSTLVTSVNYTDSTLWPRGADGLGRTLELIDYYGNQNDGGNWFDGCMFGSPGLAYTPCNPDIVFSEINYNSNPSFDAGDWIELHNTTSSNISLNGYSLKDSKDSNIFFFPAGINLTANGYREVVQDVTKFITRHSNVTSFNGPFLYGFKSKGEAIRLFGSDGKLKFSVLYNNNLPWPVEADSLGYTLELLDIHGKMNDPFNWFVCSLEGSPGTAFDPACLDGLEEKKSTLIFSLNQTLVSNNLNFNYENDNNKSGEIIIVDLLGRILKNFKIGTGMNQVEISTFPNGIYLIQLKSGNVSITKKFIKQ